MISESSRSRYGDRFNARDAEEAHRARERQERRAAGEGEQTIFGATFGGLSLLASTPRKTNTNWLSTTALRSLALGH